METITIALASAGDARAGCATEPSRSGVPGIVRDTDAPLPLEGVPSLALGPGASLQPLVRPSSDEEEERGVGDDEREDARIRSHPSPSGRRGVPGAGAVGARMGIAKGVIAPMLRQGSVKIASGAVRRRQDGVKNGATRLSPFQNLRMANDKFRRMKIRSKAKTETAWAWDVPKPKRKRPRDARRREP